MMKSAQALSAPFRNWELRRSHLGDSGDYSPTGPKGVDPGIAPDVGAAAAVLFEAKIIDVRSVSVLECVEVVNSAMPYVRAST
jgi:hypothetical protein